MKGRMKKANNNFTLSVFDNHKYSIVLYANGL